MLSKFFLIFLLYLSYSTTAFIHPGSIIPPHRLSYLRTIPDRKNSYVRQGYTNLMREVNDDISKKSNARREVCVVFNPSSHDLPTFPSDVQQRLMEEQRKNEDLIKRGVIAGHEQFTGDSIRIYKHTLAFLITNRPRHAFKAIELLNSWSTTCKVFGLREQNGPLEAGWGLVNMAQSAELLKYNFRGWNNTIESRFVNFVENLLMPNLRYYDRGSSLIDFPSRSNWGTTIVQARLQYAIFRNNTDEYTKSLNMTRQLMTNILTGRNGRTSETLRDIVHAQYGLAGITGITELFYHQGLNVYRDRLMSAYEYHARILLGDIPSDLKGKQLEWVGFIPAQWEMVYNAFVNRLKRSSMPNTLKLLQQKRAEGYDKHWGLGTLTHYIPIGR